MATTKGIDVRRSVGGTLLLRSSIKDAAGAKVTTGTATVRIFEYQVGSDPKTFDFNDNTFKTSAITTPTANLTHRKGDNGAYDTGVWTFDLAVTTAFAVGATYLIERHHASAGDVYEHRDIQWGSMEGDALTVVGTELVATDMQAISGIGQAAIDLALHVDKLTLIGSRATQSSVDVIDTNVDTLIANYTAARAAYLDNLNIGEAVASSSQVNAIQNNTRVVIDVPTQIDVPDSGSKAPKINILLYDTLGNMEAPDSTPTIAAENWDGTDRSANLGTVTLVATGHYQVAYTVSAGAALEQIKFTITIVEGGASRTFVRSTVLVDTALVGFTSADRTQLGDIHGKLPPGSITDAAAYTAGRAANLDNLDATVSSRATQAAVTTIDTVVDAIKAVTDLFAFTGNDVRATLDGESVIVGNVIAAALAPFFTTNSGQTYATAVAGSVVKEIADNAAGGGGGDGSANIMDEGTAQAGGANTITLAATASSTNDHYQDDVVYIHAGTGAGQSQTIDTYAGSTRIATVTRNWAVQPDATSQYRVVAGGQIPGATAPTTNDIVNAMAAAVLDSLGTTTGTWGWLLKLLKNEFTNKAVANSRTGQTTFYENDGATASHARKLQSGSTEDEVDYVPVSV